MGKIFLLRLINGDFLIELAVVIDAVFAEAAKREQLTNNTVKIWETRRIEAS